MPDTVLIIDDHPVVVFGLQFLLKDDLRYIICGTAGDASAALGLAKTKQPDLAVLDLVLGGRDGLELLKAMITEVPTIRVLIYSSQKERIFARKCMAAGAWGYLQKAEGLPAVTKALEAISAGDRYFRDIDGSPDRSEKSKEQLLSQLSNRELQVLRMVGEGAATGDIAVSLGISPKTVGTYRERIKIKLSLETVRDLEEFARDYAAGIFS